jgi:DNA-binding response OmpR family regulator
MLKAMKLLLVEDCLDLVQALSRALTARGCAVFTCGEGQEALALLRRQTFDAIVLDLGLPGLDGLHVLQRLRRSDDLTPVLILTAQGAVGDRVAGLNAGADDYLAKPFDLDELEARLRALVRRRQGAGDARCGLLRCDRETGAFFCDDKALDLPAREAAALRALMQRPGHAVPKQRLFAAVFAAAPTAANEASNDAGKEAAKETGKETGKEGEAPSPDAIEVVVHRLRKRLHNAAVEIITLRGVGYVLSEDSAALLLERTR